MDSDTPLKDYSEEIPLEIKTLLKGLSNDDRLGILIALMKHGKMSFKEMKEKFDLHSSSLSNHLTTLQDGNLIENFYEKRNEKGFSYYDVTDIPETVFDSLFNIVYSPVSETEEYATESDLITEKQTVTGSSPSIETQEKTVKQEILAKQHHRPRSATITNIETEPFDGAGSI